MKITSAEIIEDKNEKLKDYTEVISVYLNNNNNKQAITINSTIEIDKLLLCASRLNQTISQMIEMPYEEYLKTMKNAYDFANKYENLCLSDEQLEKLVNKALRGF